MVEPTNLRRFRKRKQREAEAEIAEQNRKIHGISSKLRKQTKLQKIDAFKRLDGKQLDKK